MARIGKNVNVDDPIYLLDKHRGVFHIPLMNGRKMTVKSIKHINREAYDHNYFDLIVDGKEYRVHKDELQAGLQYV